MAIFKDEIQLIEKNNLKVNSKRKLLLFAVLAPTALQGCRENCFAMIF